LGIKPLRFVLMCHYYSVYIIKIKVDFWRPGFLSSQSEQSEKFSKALIGWKKAGLPKKPLLI